MILRHIFDPGTITVIHYQRRDRRAVRDLLEQPNHLHCQLDWAEIGDWLEQSNARAWTIWQGTRLVGLIGFGETLSEVCWLRVLLFRMEVDMGGLLQHSWSLIQPQLIASGASQVAVLIGDEFWMVYLRTLGFQPLDEVVTLRRASMDLPSPLQSPVQVRGFMSPDMQSIFAIDQAAFLPPWQMSLFDLRQAERMCASAMVAVHEGKVVGFQFSTFYFDGAHLARLAVHPDLQGRGVGHALMTDLILRMSKRSVYVMTVNTQLTNLQSQRLYERFRFSRTGYDLPVWTTAL
jgi:GNAT superfamily N-acetyltransferase